MEGEVNQHVGRARVRGVFVPRSRATSRNTYYDYRDLVTHAPWRLAAHRSDRAYAAASAPWTLTQSALVDPGLSRHHASSRCMSAGCARNHETGCDGAGEGRRTTTAPPTPAIPPAMAARVRVVGPFPPLPRARLHGSLARPLSARPPRRPPACPAPHRAARAVQRRTTRQQRPGQSGRQPRRHGPPARL
jgi:hypothetical protein